MNLKLILFSQSSSTATFTFLNLVPGSPVPLTRDLPLLPLRCARRDASHSGRLHKET